MPDHHHLRLGRLAFDRKTKTSPVTIDRAISARAEEAQLRGRDRLNLVVEDDTLDDIADIAAVEPAWADNAASIRCLTAKKGSGFVLPDPVGVTHGDADLRRMARQVAAEK
jgi:hypothetical protein